MVNSLNDILEYCKDKYKLTASTGDNEFYISFLQRQEVREKTRNHDYNLDFKTSKNRGFGRYFKEMADKLLVFAYLSGRKEIIAGYNGNTEIKRISSVDDLYLLRPAEIGRQSKENEDFTYSIPLERRTDLRLYHLITRISKRKSVLKTQNWSETINEICKDEEVIKHFCQEIDYKMILASKSPNPLTHNHGGNRKSERFRKPGNNFSIGSPLSDLYKSRSNSEIETFLSNGLPVYRQNGFSSTRSSNRDIFITYGEWKITELITYAVMRTKRKKREEILKSIREEYADDPEIIDYMDSTHYVKPKKIKKSKIISKIKSTDNIPISTVDLLEIVEVNTQPRRVFKKDIIYF